MLVNTSFNVRGEPIVCSPQDAFRCFMHTGLDLLVIGNFMIWKDQQNVSIASLKSPVGAAD
jgi:carbamoyltransferase